MVHDAHALLVTQCLRVMNERLRQDICNIEDPSLFNSEVKDLPQRLDAYVPEELRYACLNWVEHLTSTPSMTTELLAQLEVFCDQHILQWIEVVSLLGRLPSSVDMLSSAKTWCVVRTPIQDDHDEATV
jgi:hypothetical protein